MDRPAKALTAHYTGRAVLLNPGLVAPRRADEAAQAPKEVHAARLRLTAAMEATEDPSELMRLAREVDDLELRRQRDGGFDEVAALHMWFLLPRCACPKDANLLLRGHSFRAVREDCPIHGPLLPDPSACLGGCPSHLPLGDGAGGILCWLPAPMGIRIVDILCAVHGAPLLSLRRSERQG